MSNVPTDLRYAASHEWVRLAGDSATVGISDHAQAELTDIVYVELPKVGAAVKAGQQVCVVESVKAASDIYAPVGGTISAVNDALGSNPALLNTDPYGGGWIFKLNGVSADEAASLKSPADYSAQLG
ncbi:MAG: glycine cleavage system protein GcvH [Chthoniobacteraceae bacterium]